VRFDVLEEDLRECDQHLDFSRLDGAVNWIEYNQTVVLVGIIGDVTEYNSCL
jgi:hypothetical protein